MTIMKGVAARLSACTEINPKKDKPKELKLKFEDADTSKYLNLDKENISPENGKEGLTITCKEEFTKVQIIQVLADGNICGKLKIMPNAKKFQRDIKVLFVKVTTNINKQQPGKPMHGSKELFIRTLNQALITVSEGIKEVTLDCTGWFGQSFSFTHHYCTSRDGKHVIDSARASKMRDYLTNELKCQFGDKYEGYYQVFFFNESCFDSKSGYLNGYAYPDSFFGVYFANHNAATVGHEMFHALGLLHTFDYSNPEKSDYAYKFAKTDNMLDYSHAAGIERKSLFY